MSIERTPEVQIANGQTRGFVIARVDTNDNCITHLLSVYGDWQPVSHAIRVEEHDAFAILRSGPAGDVVPERRHGLAPVMLPTSNVAERLRYGVRFCDGMLDLTYDYGYDYKVKHVERIRIGEFMLTEEE